MDTWGEQEAGMVLRESFVRVWPGEFGQLKRARKGQLGIVSGRQLLVGVLEPA